MYADPFVVDNDNVSPATVTRTFDRINYPGGGVASLYKNAATDDGTFPEHMKVAHTVVGKGAGMRDRHMVRFEASSVDGTSIGTHTPCVAYAVFDIPRSYKGASVEYQLARMLVGFLRGAGGADIAVPDYTTNFAKLLNGEG